MAAPTYIVRCAGTLAAAQAEIAAFLPDMVLLDVMLPDGTGFDFCQQYCRPVGVPVIFLTCQNEPRHIVEGLERGGDDYITKPYDLNVLSSRISAVLRRAGGFASGKIEVPPLSINLANDQVSFNGEPVAMARKEVQLLAFLASHLGQAFSTEEIYDTVWGEPSAGATRTVTVHISSLRKKLGPDFEELFEISFTADRKYTLWRTTFLPEEGEG